MAKQPDSLSRFERNNHAVILSLRSLPRWFQVAFGARCARRVQPIFANRWPEAKKLARAVDRAISYAELAASDGRASDLKNRIAAQATRAANAVRSEDVNAADAASCAAHAVLDTEPLYAVLDAADTATYAVPVKFRSAIVAAMWNDIRRLRNLSSAGKWTVEASVPSSFFSEPLWPYGTPAGWIEAESADEKNRNFVSRQRLHDEVKNLPRWARVAFAARCARRVQPLLEATWPTVPNKHLTSIDDSISTGESVATSGRLHLGFKEIARRAARVGCDNTAPPSAIQPAEYVADSARFIFNVIEASSAANVTLAERAVQYSADFLQMDRESSRRVLHEAMASDVQLLVHLARSGNWTNRTPVPKWFFAEPLWPKGAPKGWPASDTLSSGPPGLRRRKLVLKLTVPPMADTPENRQAFRQHVKQVILAANDLNIANGGSPLKVRDASVWMAEPAMIPVGGDEDRMPGGGR